MKSKELNQRIFKFEYLVLFLFLSLKYYLLTNIFTSEFPTFGLDSVKKIIVFLLSLIHIFLCTAVLIKIKNHFSDNIIVLSLIVTDPFYIINFYSTEALSVAIAFEILVLIFSEKNKLAGIGLFAIICAVSPVLISLKAPSFLVFVIFVMFLLAEEVFSHKTALHILITGAVSSVAGYVIVFVMKIRHISDALDAFFASQSVKPFSDTKSEIEIYRIVFVALLVVLEIAFWTVQISAYRENKNLRNRHSNFKNANKIKSKQNEEKNDDSKYLLYIVLGIVTCAVSVVSLAFGSAYDVPVTMMSFAVCLIVMNKYNPSKISETVEKNSLLIAIIVIVINSIFAKGLFESSEIMTIINQFAPM